MSRVLVNVTMTFQGTMPDAIIEHYLGNEPLSTLNR